MIDPAKAANYGKRLSKKRAGSLTIRPVKPLPAVTRILAPQCVGTSQRQARSPVLRRHSSLRVPVNNRQA